MTPQPICHQGLWVYALQMNTGIPAQGRACAMVTHILSLVIYWSIQQRAAVTESQNDKTVAAPHVTGTYEVLR